MKAVECHFLRFLNRERQFTIPIYQRTYSWAERECRQFWNDILRAGENDGIPAHFIGSIVYIEKELSPVSNQSPLLVIDGQQRLTTIMLILEAIARQLGDTEPVDGFSTEKLRSYYMLNPLEKGERHYKLVLTQTDKESLLALVQQKPQPSDYSLRIMENFAFFEKKVKDLNGNFLKLCRGLQKCQRKVKISPCSPKLKFPLFRLSWRAAARDFLEIPHSSSAEPFTAGFSRIRTR